MFSAILEYSLVASKDINRQEKQRVEICTPHNAALVMLKQFQQASPMVSPYMMIDIIMPAPQRIKSRHCDK
jgi:hypothetical protein